MGYSQFNEINNEVKRLPKLSITTNWGNIEFKKVLSTYRVARTC